MPEKIEKNTYLRRRLLKSHYYDARKYWINMYLRRRQGKNTLVWFPKITINFWYSVKITLLWCPKILKKTRI